MAGSGFKDFTTGEVLTANDVDNYLMQQTVMVFADAAARTTALSGVLAEGMFSYLKDTNSTEYYSGSAWTAVSGASGSLTSLATGTFSSNALSLTSISGAYKDLVLVIRNAYLNDDIGIRVNTDSGSNYGWTQTPSTQTANNSAASNSRWQISYPNVTTGNGPNFLYMTIYDYANTNSYKTCNSIFGGNPQGSKALSNNSGVWASTSAITGISSSNSFTSGSYILYGVN